MRATSLRLLLVEMRTDAVCEVAGDCIDAREVTGCPRRLTSARPPLR